MLARTVRPLVNRPGGYRSISNRSLRRIVLVVEFIGLRLRLSALIHRMPAEQTTMNAGFVVQRSMQAFALNMRFRFSWELMAAG